MSQFQFTNAVTDMTRMDGPLQNAPLPRWQRKAQETLLRIHPSDNGVTLYSVDCGLPSIWSVA